MGGPRPLRVRRHCDSRSGAYGRGLADSSRASASHMKRSLGALCSLICAALIVALWSAASAAGSLRGELFVLDPGHGTRYPDGSPLNVGAVGPSGLQEQQVVLDVGEDLAALLRAAGAKVVLTRSHAAPFRTGSDKRLDNRARAALAN